MKQCGSCTRQKRDDVLGKSLTGRLFSAARAALESLIRLFLYSCLTGSRKILPLRKKSPAWSERVLLLNVASADVKYCKDRKDTSSALAVLGGQRGSRLTRAFPKGRDSCRVATLL